MARGYPHVSLWTTLACAGGVPIRRLTPALARWAERHAIEDHLVTHQFTGSVPTDWGGAADLTTGRCIRVARTASDIREYLIEDVEDGQNHGGLTRVTAYGVEYQLATVGLTTATSIEADPEDAVDAILDDAPAWLVTGTVTPSGTIDVEAVGGGTSYGAALRQLVDACRRNNEPCEVWLSRNGDTEYLVNVSAYNSGAATIDLPYQTGLTGLTRTRPRSATLTHAVDEGAGVAESYWYVSAVTGTTVTTTPLQPGLGAAIEADQWNTNYALRDNAGNLHTITDTEVLSARETRFTMADSTGIAVGELVALVTAAGGDVTSVTLPSIGTPAIPLVRPTASGADPWTNLAYNGAFRLWSGGSPVGYTSTGAAQSSVSGGWKRGGSSALLPDDGDYSVQQVRTFYAPAAGAIHYGYEFKPTSHSEYMLVTFTDPATGSDSGEENADVPPALGNGTWYERTRSYACPSGVVTVGITVRNNGGGESGERAALYLDSVGIYYAPAQPVFREGSGPARAIANANLILSQYAASAVSYSVRFLDLYAHAPTTAGLYRQAHLGGMARIICDALTIRDTVRVVEYVEAGSHPEDAGLTLNNRLRTLTSTLGGGIPAAPTFEASPLPGTITPVVPSTPPTDATVGPPPFLSLDYSTSDTGVSEISLLPVPYETGDIDENVGGFTVSSGIITVPVSGRYLVTIYVLSTYDPEDIYTITASVDRFSYHYHGEEAGLAMRIIHAEVVSRDVGVDAEISVNAYSASKAGATADPYIEVHTEIVWLGALT